MASWNVRLYQTTHLPGLLAQITCGSGSYLYESRVDSSGREAPDGVSNLPCTLCYVVQYLCQALLYACRCACAAESQWAGLQCLTNS